MDAPVYLDNWEMTLMPPEAVGALSYWCNQGHPGGGHEGAKKSRAMLASFREEIAAECGFRLDGPDPFEIVFTSGADESNCAMVAGAVASYTAAIGKRPHVVISEAEPASVMACCARLEKDSRCQLTVLPVGTADGDPARLGLVSPADLSKAIRASTCLVSISPGAAGTAMNYGELAAVARARRVPYHTDASAVFGLAPVMPLVLGIDAMSLDFGRLHGAQAGALVIRRSLVAGYDLAPIIHGPENAGLRGGPANVPCIGASLVGFRIAMAGAPREGARLAQLRDALKAALTNQYPSCELREGRCAAPGPGPAGALWPPGVPEGRPALVWVAPSPGRPCAPGLLLFAVAHAAPAAEIAAALERAGVIVGAPGRKNPPRPEPRDPELRPKTLARRLYFGLDPLSSLGIPPSLAANLLRVSLSRYSTAEDIKAFARAFATVVPPRQGK